MFDLFRNPAPLSTDCTSLVLRLTFGGLMVSHGWPKFTTYAEHANDFMNFMGLGAPTSLALVVFAEFFCSVLIMVGLFTRAAVVPPAITMLVAIIKVHWNDPLGDKELPLMYLLAYVAIFLAGSGRYSLDAVLRRRRPVITMG